jgi:hypothetical protein
MSVAASPCPSKKTPTASLLANDTATRCRRYGNHAWTFSRRHKDLLNRVALWTIQDRFHPYNAEARLRLIIGISERIVGDGGSTIWGILGEFPGKVKRICSFSITISACDAKRTRFSLLDPLRSERGAVGPSASENAQRSALWCIIALPDKERKEARPFGASVRVKVRHGFP